MVEFAHGIAHGFLYHPEVHGHAALVQRVGLHAHGEANAPVVAVHALALLDAGKRVRRGESRLGGKQIVRHVS